MSVDFFERTKAGAQRNIPCIRLLPSSKMPMDQAWQEKATTDPQVLARWNAETPDANCGYVGKAELGGVWVLDIDGPAMAQDYERATGKKLTPTFTVSSSKGEHRYYAHTAGSIGMGNIGQQAGEDDPGYSVRANNEYCVSALSIHPATGKPYLITNDVPIAEADPDLVKFLVERKRQKSSGTALVSQLVSSEDLIPFGMHDVTLTAIAGKLRAYGLEEEAIDRAIAEVCEKRAVNYGSDYREMCRKIAHSVCRYKPAASLNLAKLGGVYADPAIYDSLLLRLDDKTKKSWIMENVPRACELSTEPLTWIVDEVILEHGLHLFSGKPGSMKSMTALLLAKSITTNSAFMNRKAAGRPVNVVYIDRENPQSEVRKRSAALGLLSLDNFRVWGDWSPDSPPPASFDDGRLLECAGRDDVVFIFDSLSSYLNGANENDSGEMMLIMGLARKLARACAGVIILHHQARQGIGGRGSTSIAASTDMAFIVEKEAGDVVLSEERFRCCQGYKMRWTMNFGQLGIGPYTYRLVENALGSRASDAAQENSGPRHDAELIRRAGVIIQDEFDLGRPINQTTLAKLLGILSNSRKQSILNGSSSRPWTCYTGPRGSILFKPVAKPIARSN
ncbi:MAG: bifunctional DNA primase/polymerase, partial [Candidatus Acidiferrum sp.]